MTIEHRTLSAEAEARLTLLAEMGDYRQYAGPTEDIQLAQRAIRKDVTAVLAQLNAEREHARDLNNRVHMDGRQYVEDMAALRAKLETAEREVERRFGIGGELVIARRERDHFAALAARMREHACDNYDGPGPEAFRIDLANAQLDAWLAAKEETEK